MTFPYPQKMHLINLNLFMDLFVYTAKSLKLNKNISLNLFCISNQKFIENEESFNFLFYGILFSDHNCIRNLILSSLYHYGIFIVSFITLLSPVYKLYSYSDKTNKKRNHTAYKILH